MVVFSRRKICSFLQFTAKSAPFRNLQQILLFFMKNLSFHHFFPQVIFKSDKVLIFSIVHFFYFLIIVLKLPVCFKLLYWKLPSLLLLPAVTLHLNQVFSTSSFTCMMIDVVIYTACYYCYYIFFCCWCSYTLYLIPMGKFLSLRFSPSIILYFQSGEGGSAKKT